ncbi:MAG: hypothetical protein ACFFB3_05895 [Candidatus Hodarchaeota archaeon]
MDKHFILRNVEVDGLGSGDTYEVYFQNVVNRTIENSRERGY